MHCLNFFVHIFIAKVVVVFGIGGQAPLRFDFKVVLTMTYSLLSALRLFLHKMR